MKDRRQKFQNRCHGGACETREIFRDSAGGIVKYLFAVNGSGRCDAAELSLPRA